MQGYWAGIRDNDYRLTLEACEMKAWKYTWKIPQELTFEYTLGNITHICIHIDINAKYICVTIYKMSGMPGESSECFQQPLNQ
jgi:hypothetical protein